MMRPTRSSSWRVAGRSLALAAALGATLLLACDRSTSEPGGAIRVQTLAKATIPSHGPVQVREVVRNQARYEAVWRELWGDREIFRPPVDFDREMVVAVTHPTEACLGEVEIARIEPHGFGATVKLGQSRPHLCLCAVAETTFHIVRAPRLAGPVDFEVHEIPSRCGAPGGD